jgi:hypothetical protein
MLLRVPTFKPGTYYVMDRTGQWRWVTYKIADVKQCVKTGNDQIASGLTVPLCWMHDQAAEPQELSIRTNPDSWMARGWFGEAVKWTFDPATQEAVAWCEVPDPKDATQFKRVKKVSPGLKPNYVDQRGRVWPGMSVVHIASTPRPVQLGLSSVADANRREFQGQYLSHAADDGAVWLSHDVNIRGANMADEKDPKDTPEMTEGMPDAAKLKELFGLLKQMGLHIHGEPESMDHAISLVKTAVATKQDGKLDGHEEPDGDEPMELPPVDGEESKPVGQNAMFMSLSPDLQETCISTAKMKADLIAARIQKLMDTNRIDPERYEALLAEHNSADLSVNVAQRFTKKLKWVEPKYVSDIAAYEKLKPGAFSKDAVNKSNGRAADLSLPVSKPVKRPADVEAAPADSELDEATLLLAKARGLTPEEAKAMSVKA